MSWLYVELETLCTLDIYLSFALMDEVMECKGLICSSMMLNLRSYENELLSCEKRVS